MDAKPKRRWFQFSLKALLLVTTLVAVPLARVAYLGQRVTFHNREVLRFAECLLREGEHSPWTARKHTCTSLVTNHKVLHDRYVAAMYRPWTIVDDSPPIELNQSP